MSRQRHSTFVLASGNPGKLEELRALLGDGVVVTNAGALGIELPEETGTTFEENALLKALAVHEACGHVAIADDSGLIVDALNGHPGVRSARYAGEDATDAENNEKLMSVMHGVPVQDRKARFMSAIAVVFQDGATVVTHGVCEGSIGDELRGTGGFGYDPLFVLPDGRTMAELPSDEKNMISHRAVAMQKAIEIIDSRLGERAAEVP